MGTICSHGRQRGLFWSSKEYIDYILSAPIPKRVGMDSSQHYQPLSHALHPPQYSSYTPPALEYPSNAGTGDQHREEEEEEEEDVVEEELDGHNQQPSPTNGQGSAPAYVIYLPSRTPFVFSFV